MLKTSEHDIDTVAVCTVSPTNGSAVSSGATKDVKKSSLRGNCDTLYLLLESLMCGTASS